MRKLLLTLVTMGILLLPSGKVRAQVRLSHLRCENLLAPIGLDVARPRFSWQLQAPSNRRGVRQTPYELQVAASDAGLARGRATVWQSGKVASDSSVHVTYAGPALTASRRYYWRVRVWDNTGKPSAWSATTYWQTGLLASTNWRAAWIGPGYPEDSVQRPSPLLRKEFTIAKPVSIGHGLRHSPRLVRSPNQWSARGRCLPHARLDEI